MIECGFVRGVSNPCVDHHSGRGIRTLGFGDGYASTGERADLRWRRDRLESKFKMKTVIVGHSREVAVVKEWKILNRIIQAALRIPPGRVVRLRCWGGIGKDIIIVIYAVA